MKGRSLILIFLFLLFLAQPVVAANVTESFNFTGSQSGSFTTPGTTNILPAVGYVTFGNAQSMKGIKYVTWVVPDTRWHTSNPSDDQLWEDVTFSTYGTGELGYNHVGSNYYMTIVFNDDFDISGLSGTVRIPMTGMSTYYCAEVCCLGHASLSPTSDTAVTVCGFDPGGYYSTWTATHYFYTSYTFLNTYTYDTVNGLPTMWVDKGTSPSMFNVTGIYDEYPSNSNSLEIKSNQTTWVLDVTDSFGTGYFDTVYFSLPSSSATIGFNQSYYNQPDSVRIDVSINNMNSNNYYRIDLLYYDGMVAKKLATSWNDTVIISNSTDSRVGTISTSGITLPMTIYGILKEWDTSTGIETTIAYTDEIVYNPADVGPGSIWTDKTEYNVTDTVIISYSTQIPESYISIEEPNAYNFFMDIPIGSGSYNYELSTSSVGEVIISLHSPGGDYDDSVTIDVNGSTSVYVAWMKDLYNKGELANFYYYSSNSSAQIIVYDGADNVVYGPATTQLGYHNGLVNTANTEPGTFLISMYHNGTYYNDSMVLDSTDSWVRFDNTKYYVGDTINIEYYLADPTQCISMWDGQNGLVIRFTTNYGVLVSGSMQTVPFTLSEDNEYSYDVPSKLSSGDLSLGYWKVFIEDSNGVFVTDVWDESYVTHAIDDDLPGYDSSNEIIMILFSPEGLFMIFTACLTMMGLVAAHHPAGGAAGAVVGVGFGVYFSVLPIWMLLLMVIALVVLAGVSVAVYFKGKT